MVMLEAHHNESAAAFIEAQGFRKSGLGQGLEYSLSLEPEIEIEEHNPAFMRWFLEEKDALENLIGAENIEKISHIGSTSVYGMPGRPVVDILVELRFRTDEKQARAKMSSRYRRVYLDNDGTQWISGGARRFAVYLKRSDLWNCVAFRNYLLKHPETVAQYTDLKQSLQKRFRQSPAKYNEGKSPFIERVNQKSQLLSKAAALLGKPISLSLSNSKLPGGSAYAGLRPGDSQFGQLAAYAIGVNDVNAPLKVAGVIERMDKWALMVVACPLDMDLTQAEIEEALPLPFPNHLICCHEKSVGFIPFRRTPDGLEYLLVLQSRPMSWSFPKGHMDAHETELETARREAVEEIGLELAPIPGFRTEIDYSIGFGRYKTVVLFLAEVQEHELAYGEDEISEHCFAQKDKAAELLRNGEFLRVITEAEDFLGSLESSNYQD
jgi:GrpB-like predicted nucleotidyltransferase (UPF0157 family)/8-oxo-dGTP pyrophosphatase MutT (NUDIX family)